MRLPTLAAVSLGALLVFGVAACSESKKRDAAPPTSRPIPSPVKIADEPQGIALADPKFDALPGAKADYGHLGGTVYRIEMPNQWNGRLFLYQHGFQDLAATAEVEDPPLRGYLIAHGWAWGATSYSSTALIPGRAADETAALWDHFVQTYGRPERSYIGGASMGGAATNIAAERYGDRYDGALSLCGFAGQSAQTEMVDDYFFAAAYATGITQAEFDASTDYPKMIAERIIPALEAPAKRKVFEDLVIGVTGGHRPFDRLGLHQEERANWRRAGLLIALRVGDNSSREYVVAPGGQTTSADFNRAVIRMHADEERRATFNAGNEITGELQMPVLALHTTGDWQVTIDQQQILRRRADAAGRGGTLVQRLVQSPDHCGFTDEEEERALEELAGWVERGAKPPGEDLTNTDLSRVGKEFTQAPRYGSAEADAVPGATQRVRMQGAMTLDGTPTSMEFIWAEVDANGLEHPCSYRSEVAGRQYTVAIASDAEVRGCGSPGAGITLYAYNDGRYYTSQRLAWPATPGDITIDAAFSSQGSWQNGEPGPAPTTYFYGTARDAASKRLAPGTLIEAFVGGSLCGVTSIPRVVMQFSDPDRYEIEVARPEALPACQTGAPVAFKIGGVSVAASGTNDLSTRGHALELVLP